MEAACSRSYQAQTGHFELQRTGKEIALLTDLIDLSEKAGKASDSEIQRAIQNLKFRLRESTEPSEGPITFSVTYKKVFAAALAWVVLGILMFLASAAENSNRATSGTIVGIAISGTPFIVLAGFLPTFEATWINYYLYPIGHMLIVIAVIMYWHKRKLAKDAT